MSYLKFRINGELRQMKLGYIEGVETIKVNYRQFLSKNKVPHIVSLGTSFKDLLRNDRPSSIYLEDGTMFAYKETANFDYERYSELGFNSSNDYGGGTARKITVAHSEKYTAYHTILQNSLGGDISVALYPTKMFNTNSWITANDLMLFATDEIVDGIRTIVALYPNTISVASKEISYFPFYENEFHKNKKLNCCSLYYEKAAFGWIADAYPTDIDYIQENNYFEIGTLNPIRWEQQIEVLSGSGNSTYTYPYKQDNTCNENELIKRGYFPSIYTGTNSLRYELNGGIDKTLFNTNSDNVGDGDNPQPTPEPPSPDDDYPDGLPPEPKPPDLDDDSDDIDIPTPQPSLVFQAHLITAYRLNTTQLNALANEMWNADFFSNIIKLFALPMDCLIALTEYPFNVPATVDKPIVLGNVEMDTQASIIVNPFVTINMGSVVLQEKYNSYLDYTQTKLSIFLPFIGVQQLSVEYLNAQLTLEYNIDIISGNCVAILKANSYNSKLNSVIGQWTGNIGYSVPLSGRDYGQMASAIWNTASSTVSALTTKSPTGIMTVGNSIINMIEASNGTTSAGSLNANAGHLGVVHPYIIISRPVQKINTAYYQYKGREFNGYTNFNTLKGYTEISECALIIPDATQQEIEEIQQLLAKGVYF